MKTKYFLSSMFLCVVYLSFGQVRTKEVVYHKDGQGHQIKGYLALAEGNEKKPGIILIHEWWGLNDDIKQKAREFAQNGYHAFAVDLYNGENTRSREKAGELAGGVQKNMDEAFANLKSALDFLKKNEQVMPGRLASIGWCFGGGWSYLMAKNNLGVKASIIYYGSFNPKDDLQKMRATILGHFAEKDRWIMMDDVKAFQVKLKTLSGDHKVFIYPNSSHGFANPDNDIYSKEASELAWKRTIEFLEKHL